MILFATAYSVNRHNVWLYGVDIGDQHGRWGSWYRKHGRVQSSSNSSSPQTLASRIKMGRHEGTPFFTTSKPAYDIHNIDLSGFIHITDYLTVHRCLHGMAPPYLCDDLQRVSEVNRRRLRSSTSNAVVVPETRLVTVGDRAFPAAGSRLWNSLPTDVTSATSLPVFCSRLKSYLFSVYIPAWPVFV